MKPLACFGIAITFAVGLSAQDVRLSPMPAPRPPAGVPYAREEAAVRPGKEPEVKYDRFTGTTSIAIQGTLLSDATLGGKPYPVVRTIDIKAEIACLGDVRKCAAPKVGITFKASTWDWSFNAASRRVFFLVDDKPLGSIEYAWDGRVDGVHNYQEYMAAMVPLELFTKLVEAQAVELRIGLVETKLRPGELAALKQILDFVEPEVAKAPQNVPNSGAKKGPKI